MAESTVLITGSTGYIGGRLAPLLLERGLKVRAMARTAAKLAARPWARHPDLQIAEADILNEEAMRQALRGVRAAYYLVHSMESRQRNFADTDRNAAQIMARAAAAEGVERIIYLSGLMPPLPEQIISGHLRSRAEVAAILQAGPVPVTVLRAAQILGSGSASFEMLRYLADRLPVMLTPRWVRTECQPIAVRNVLEYLAGCLEHPETIGQTYDIGGPFIETYERLFRIYCEEAGLKPRLIIPLPFLSPRLSSYWVGLVSPVPVALARPLIRGLNNRVVCSDYRIRDIIPQELLDCRSAIRMALDKVRQQIVPTCWSDAGHTRLPEWAACGDAPYAGGRIHELSFRVTVDAPLAEVWSCLSAVGGRTGWYAGDLLWKLRGWLDSLSRGPGLNRGRRNAARLQLGDALDFWRVVDIQENQRLLLLAEMKLPGEALLEFTLEPGPSGVEIRQRSRFLPRGVAGEAYWWATWPLHILIFRSMLAAIAKKLEANIVSGPERV